MQVFIFKNNLYLLQNNAKQKILMVFKTEGLYCYEL